jgi:hypothetical protein
LLIQQRASYISKVKIRGFVTMSGFSVLKFFPGIFLHRQEENKILREDSQ